MEDSRTKFFAVIGILATISALFLASTLSEPNLGDNQNTGAYAIFHTEEKNISIDLELAETRKEKREGLMNRTELGENKGMLFIFSEEEDRSFWMKNTYIPLDIIFIDSNNTIVDIKKAFPEPNTSEEELELYKGGPSKYVLEVNQNFTERKGIEEGDKITLNIDN